MAGTSWSSTSKVSVAVSYRMEACFRSMLFKLPLVVSFKNTRRSEIKSEVCVVVVVVIIILLF